MPIFYHIHRSIKPSELENNLTEGYPLYFSKKNSGWYNMEKHLGITDYGGYIIYKINIPNNCFTESFHKNAKYKILKLTKWCLKCITLSNLIYPVPVTLWSLLYLLCSTTWRAGKNWAGCSMKK